MVSTNPKLVSRPAPPVIDSGGSTWAHPGVKLGQTHRRRDASEVRDGGATRDRATGHGRGRAWARWRALAPAHRMVVVAVPEVAGVDGGELGCGRRSSGAVGIDVAGGLGRR